MIDVGNNKLNPGQVHWPSKSCLLSYLENAAYKKVISSLEVKLHFKEALLVIWAHCYSPSWTLCDFGVNLATLLNWKRGFDHYGKEGDVGVPEQVQLTGDKGGERLWPNCDQKPISPHHCPTAPGGAPIGYMQIVRRINLRHPTQVFPLNRDVHCTIL